jgi:hypothetical protein
MNMHEFAAFFSPGGGMSVYCIFLCPCQGVVTSDMMGMVYGFIIYVFFVLLLVMGTIAGHFELEKKQIEIKHIQKIISNSQPTGRAGSIMEACAHLRSGCVCSSAIFVFLACTSIQTTRTCSSALTNS